jgi:uncharacterized protein (DUF433 family)
MQLEDYFDFLEDPYAIRIKGRRIGLEHVVERYKEGQTAEQIAAYYDDLPLESIYAAILYYLHYKDTVDAYLADIEEFDREQRRLADANPSPAMLRIRALKEQLKREGKWPVEDPVSA